MASATIQRNLKRDIIVILLIKMLIVLAAAFFVFSSHQRPRIDDEALDGHILDSLSASKTESRSP